MLTEIFVMVTLQNLILEAQTTPPLFQCQPSSQQDGLVFTPNIPDLYFNHENAANFRNSNLSILSHGVTYIFPIPPVSAERDCNGTVVEMQFCYQYERNTQNRREFGAFEFLSLTKNGTAFTVINRITVATTVMDSTCSQGINERRIICCSDTNFNDFGKLEIPSADYIFGITTTSYSILLLTFSTTVLEYQFDQFQVANFPSAPGATVLLTGNSISRPLPIFRFLIDPSSSENRRSNNHTITVDDDTTTTSFTSMSPHSPDEVSSAVLGGVVGGVTGVVLLLFIFTIIITSAVAVIRKQDSQAVPHSQVEDVELQQNQAYIKTSAIPVQDNECYGTTSERADQLYATPIEGRDQHSVQRLPTDNYDYVIP